MEKGIDKSAQRALEAYPIEMYEEVGWRCVDKNSDKRKYFIEGYHQAEKDLELTLEDVEIIINAFLDFCIENNERGKKKRCTDKEYSQEVLKRFKERKEK